MEYVGQSDFFECDVVASCLFPSHASPRQDQGRHGEEEANLTPSPQTLGTFHKLSKIIPGNSRGFKVKTI